MSTYTVGCSLQVAANGQQPAKFNNIIGTANDIALTENGVREMTIGTDSGLIKSYVKSVVRNLTVKTGGSPRFTILSSGIPTDTTADNAVCQDYDLSLHTRIKESFLGGWTLGAVGNFVTTNANVIVQPGAVYQPSLGFAYIAELEAFATNGTASAAFRQRVRFNAFASFGSLVVIETVSHVDAGMATVSTNFVLSGGFFYQLLVCDPLHSTINWRVLNKFRQQSP